MVLIKKKDSYELKISKEEFNLVMWAIVVSKASEAFEEASTISKKGFIAKFQEELNNAFINGIVPIVKKILEPGDNSYLDNNVFKGSDKVEVDILKDIDSISEEDMYNIVAMFISMIISNAIEKDENANVNAILEKMHKTIFLLGRVFLDGENADTEIKGKPNEKNKERNNKSS